MDEARHERKKRRFKEMTWIWKWVEVWKEQLNVSLRVHWFCGQDGAKTTYRREDGTGLQTDGTMTANLAGACSEDLELLR